MMMRMVLFFNGDLCVQLSEDEYPDDDKIEREANVSKYTYVHIK